MKIIGIGKSVKCQFRGKKTTVKHLIVQCEKCGSIYDRVKHQIDSNIDKNCYKCAHPSIDMVGRKNGDWIVTSFHGLKRTKKSRWRYWNCQCTLCGNYKICEGWRFRNQSIGKCECGIIKHNNLLKYYQRRESVLIPK